MLVIARVWYTCWGWLMFDSRDEHRGGLIRNDGCRPPRDHSSPGRGPRRVLSLCYYLRLSGSVPDY